MQRIENPSVLQGYVRALGKHMLRFTPLQSQSTFHLEELDTNDMSLIQEDTRHLRNSE